MAEINEKSLENLAALARLKLSASEEKKFLKDLQGILDHFQELRGVDTDGVDPITGGTSLKNVFRKDEEIITPDEASVVKDAFPETRDGFLKVPPVFDN